MTTIPDTVAPLTTPTTAPRTPRVWPGVAIVALQWILWYVVPLVAPTTTLYAMLAGIFGGGLLTAVWWLFFSRLPWVERLGALVLSVLAFLAASRLVHPSIANAGMGMMLAILSIPFVCLALVTSLLLTRRRLPGVRRAAIVAGIVLVYAGFMVVRTGGISGEAVSDLHWRWTPTPEERLLASASVPKEKEAGVATKIASTPPEWPGFRGPERNSLVRGTRLATDWSQTPPVQLWHRAVGPGWSSFAVQGDVFFTQEQRGEEEMVACYLLATGEPVWMHGDHARFWESNAGAGPRGTPTLHAGRVYTLGATGIANALSAADGSVLWSKNAQTDTGAKLPMWAFAGSPLIVDRLAVFATSGRLVAYDADTGTRRWVYSSGGGGYSSPHIATLDGVKQILFYNTNGISSVAPADGSELWKYEWKGDGIVQPAFADNGDLFLGSGFNAAIGVRRLGLTHGPQGWTAEERWTSTGLKPYFNDFVVHKDHAYGFDGGLLGCIRLTDGKRLWKGGRYGHGQVLLLPDQDLLLVLSEQGRLALVAAKPDDFHELARHEGIAGKTWNHPALVGNTLLVRNAEEMAAFRLPSR